MNDREVEESLNAPDGYEDVLDLATAAARITELTEALWAAREKFNRLSQYAHTGFVIDALAAIDRVLEKK